MELPKFHGVYILLFKEILNIRKLMTGSSCPAGLIIQWILLFRSLTHVATLEILNKSCRYLLAQRLILSMATSVCRLKWFECLNVWNSSMLNYTNSKNILWYGTTQCTETSWFYLSPSFCSSHFTSWLWLWMGHLISVSLIPLSGERVKRYLLSYLLQGCREA